MLKRTGNYIIGLMSGTSLDGIDAALVYIDNTNGQDCLHFIDSYYEAYPPEVRKELTRLVSGNTGGSRDIALMSSLLGVLYADCVEHFLDKIAFSPDQLTCIASHGQTIYHSLEKEDYLGYQIQNSLQIGEASYLAERFQCPVISDFRVRDIAASGLGAPLVPFVEKSLYQDPNKNLVYLNIGGIGNITYIPKAGDDILGFDSGPGNMLIDQAMEILSDGKLHYDEDGNWGAKGTISNELLRRWMSNPYYKQNIPKNSGRENFGQKEVHSMLTDAQELKLSPEDIIASLTHLTAKVNADAIRDFCPSMPDTLIVSGGGSQNPNIMNGLKKELPSVEIITGDVLGYPNEAKEAVAFAYLGYRRFHEKSNSIPSVTGAKHSVSMGKTSI